MIGGMQGRNAGKEGCQTGGSRKGGIQEKRDTVTGKERYSKRTGKEGHNQGEIPVPGVR